MGKNKETMSGKENMRGKNKRKEKKWENVMAEMGGEKDKLGI